MTTWNSLLTSPLLLAFAKLTGPPPVDLVSTPRSKAIAVLIYLQKTHLMYVTGAGFGQAAAGSSEGLRWKKMLKAKVSSSAINYLPRVPDYFALTHAATVVFALPCTGRRIVRIKHRVSHIPKRTRC